MSILQFKVFHLTRNLEAIHCNSWEGLHKTIKILQRLSRKRVG